MINETNEKILLKQAKQGNTDSLEKLIELYKSMVNSIVRGYFLIGGDNDDLVQEGMIGLYKAILSYDENCDTKFFTYSFLCVKRQVMGAVRASKRFKNMPLNRAYISINNQGMLLFGNSDEENDDGDECGIFLSSEQLSPEEKFFEREQGVEITKKIKEMLSDFEFNVLALYLNGFSYADIGYKLNKDSKSIDNAINRLKKKLQSIYQGGKICI